MEKVLIFVLASFTSAVGGFYIKSDQFRQKGDRYADVIEPWLSYKNKFGLEPGTETFVQRRDRFNEIEALLVIPSIIKHYKAGNIEWEEEMLLSRLYGDLWTLIVNESNRHSNEPMDPVLKSLFDSYYLLKGLDNPNEHRKIKRMHTNPASKLHLEMNENQNPAQRILNTAGILIHQISNNDEYRRNYRVQLEKTNKHPAEIPEKQEYLIKNIPQKAVLNLRLSNIPINSIVRNKRNVEIHLKGNDLLATQVDGILKIFGSKRGRDSTDEEDDDDDDYYDDKRSASDIDYLYEDSYEYDEEPLIAKSDPEYASIKELMFLAARHRLQREREETKLKASREHFLSLK